MTSLFIDTSYLIGLEIVDDQSHEAAVKHWSSLMASGRHALMTHSYVFTETVTYLNNLRLHSKAVEVGKDLLSSRRIDLIHVNEELFYEAWDYSRDIKTSHSH